MPLRRWIIVFFSAVQLLGIACSWLWDHPASAVSSLLWGTALVTLFPGNLLGAWIVEKLFWQSHLSLVSMGIISTVLLVVINAIIMVSGSESFTGDPCPSLYALWRPRTAISEADSLIVERWFCSLFCWR
jgi:hypothetical protein